MKGVPPVFRFKNIRLRPLLIHLIVTLIYPVFRALTAEKSGLLIFTDALTIIGLIMIAGGVIYALFLHGDFDISGFLLKRGVSRDPNKSYMAYLYDVYEKREGAFNYPLFVGLCYVILSVIIAYLPA